MRAASASAAAVLVALNLALALRAGRAYGPRLRGAVEADTVELGEALRLAAHPRDVNVAYRMPFGTLLEADAFVGLSPARWAACAAAAYAATVLLVYALAWTLGGTWAGLCAAAAWQALFIALPAGPGAYKQFWLTGLGLLAAVVLASHARRPRLASAAAAGAAFGLTALTRSTYLFFVPALALAEAARGGPRAARAARAALLLAGAALVLGPWLAMNARLSGRFLPFEDGPMYMNVVTGALGAATTAHGDYAALMDEPAGEAGRSPLLWAARTAAANPGRYLGAVASRLGRLLSRAPWLFALAALGFALARRDAGARATALQCLYFAAIICSMSVEDDHFPPLWPLLLALAAAPLSRLKPPPGEPAWRGAVAAGVAASVLLAGAMAARSGAAALSYAARAARRAPWSDAALDEALARRPSEPWAALAAARRRLRERDPAGAVRALEESEAALGDLPRRRALLAWARAKNGDPAPLLALEAGPPFEREPYNDDSRDAVAAYQALVLDAAGRPREARARMGLALEAWRARQGFIDAGSGPLAAALDARLRRSADETFLRRLDQLFGGEDPRDWERALELAVGARPSFDGEERLARLKSERGDRPGAARAAEAASRLARTPEELHRLHFLWIEAGRLDRAARALRGLLAKNPGSAVYWSDLGVLLYRTRDAAGAEDALRRALRLDPACAPAAASLSVVLRETGRKAQARELCVEALKRAPSDPGLLSALRACRDETAP